MRKVAVSEASAGSGAWVGDQHARLEGLVGADRDHRQGLSKRRQVRASPTTSSRARARPLPPPGSGAAASSLLTMRMV